MTLFTPTAVAACTVLAFALYYAGLVIYRLYFHPLAKFPGSKIAATSLWYEFYYNVVLRGKFMWKLQEMHAKYGGHLLTVLNVPVKMSKPKQARSFESTPRSCTLMIQSILMRYMVQLPGREISMGLG
jgi:hypothetical protein